MWIAPDALSEGHGIMASALRQSIAALHQPNTFRQAQMTVRATTPLRFPGQLIGAIHLGDKREIAAELALSGIGAGVLIFHGIRPDGSCTCGGFNCPNAGKHPDVKLVPRGVWSATRDPSRAWQLFNLYPDRNLALALGPDLAAGDWDPQHGADLNDTCGLPGRTMTARSGGGGRHRLVRVRPSLKLKGGVLARGVEFRTGNQAVVIEKSLHRSGGAYAWNDLLAPIAMLPRDVAAQLLATTPPHRVSGVMIDPGLLGDNWIGRRWPEVRGVHQALLCGKYRDQVRPLLNGEWEAGYATQSEAEYNLLLLISGITDDQNLWLATLLSSGLGTRDREGMRRPDGHGHKLMRSSYLSNLFANVAARRADMQRIGDPNLPFARACFCPLTEQQVSGLTSPQAPVRGGDVLDAKKNRRGRPKGASKRKAAQVALIHFLASHEVVRDRQGYVRVPIGDAAQSMQISRETFRKAVNALLSDGMVEGPLPRAYKKHGRFAKDRCLRLVVPEADALTRLETWC